MSASEYDFESMVKELDASEERWGALAHDIWEHPEVSLQEEKASGWLAAALEEKGFHVRRSVAGMPTAFVAEYKRGLGRPVLAILGEFDALPGVSQEVATERRARSAGGAGHACGHNLLGVAGAAAAVAVKERMGQENIAGTVRYYGCPAEETLVGKTFMVREGLFDDVDAAVTWHPGEVNAVREGSTSAMISTRFRFSGTAAHAAANPEAGRSALDAVELLDVGANYLREHVPSTVRLHYVITNGGGEPNVVPAAAEVWYYVRAPRFSDVWEVYERLQKVAQGAALMTETMLEERFLTGCYNCLPNDTIGRIAHASMLRAGALSYSREEEEFAKRLQKTVGTAVTRRAAQFYDRPDLGEVVLAREIQPLGTDVKLRMGSTEVGDVSWLTPLAQFSTTCYAFGTPGHSWQIVASAGSSIGNKGMMLAAKTMAATTLELLTSPHKLEQARQEFAGATANEHYESPLPPGLQPPLDQLATH